MGEEDDILSSLTSLGMAEENSATTISLFKNLATAAKKMREAEDTPEHVGEIPAAKLPGMRKRQLLFLGREKKKLEGKIKAVDEIIALLRSMDLEDEEEEGKPDACRTS